MNLKIKPRDLNDGVLLYCGESEEGYGHFTSLALKNKHLEFRFDVGSGPAIIKSSKELKPNEWVAVTVSRYLGEGKLVVNGEAPVSGRTPGGHKPLSLHTPLYVGGYDEERIKLNPGVGVEGGFHGCVSAVSFFLTFVYKKTLSKMMSTIWTFEKRNLFIVYFDFLKVILKPRYFLHSTSTLIHNDFLLQIDISGSNLNLITSVMDSANVQDCSDLESHNNQNNDIEYGHDHEHDDRPHHRPIHRPQTTGCSSNPCRNDGHCYPTSPTDYTCSCINGYSGRDCEIAPNLCDQLKPCQNGGSCTGNTTKYKCDCPLSYTGLNCEQRKLNSLKLDVIFFPTLLKNRLLRVFENFIFFFHKFSYT